MPRLKTNTSTCSVARALELLGDRWSFLLIREVIFGTRRFDDFAAHLGIARNVLAGKLAALVDAGILEQRPLHQDARRLGYHLTEMGDGLLPALVALLQWGDRWLQTPDTVPLRIVERATGAELPAVALLGAEGKPLTRRELDWMPGPGAGHPGIAPLVAAYEKQRRVVPRPIPPAPTSTTASPRPKTKGKPR